MVTGLSRQAVARTQDNVLAASATTIAETLRSEQGEVRLELPYSAFSMLGAISQDRVFYRVSAGDRVLTGYDDLPSPTGAAPGIGQVVFDTGDYSNETIRMASVTRLVLAGGQPVPVTVTVAQTRSGVSTISADLSRQAAILSVAFFLVAVGFSAIAARTSLRPLNEIAASVSRRGPSDLRPLRRDAPTELAPLMLSLNRLMGRLGQSIRRSEDFIAEAAHRIRTPLATVRAQAEIALRSVGDETEKRRLRQIIRAVDESSRSAGQLLDHATVIYRTDDLALSPVDLAELVGQTAAALEPTAAMKEIRLDVAATPARVMGDPVLLDNALRNVLDNAIKYSPEETEVSIRVTTKEDQVHITVTDEGPGLGDGPLGALTERFRRGDDTQGIVGSGLGLTIAEDVLLAHDGRLDLKNRDGGTGTCVTLVLPCS
ncbi:sensor histidine kinase N-terminal domain-containing protein [Ponticoccus sp. SC2-23]|nr:sensor histidine kinase N-terminal domain-containing protein [Ponticoccus sp. SC6-9]MBM1231525.1 sensor histidine kinase N-terminal domain-containing protein [Ponticoccus sp. SC6-38]MBM1236039.1 sensor histidine kinase N-terminal domain-containing protein [Ponticoccus sp. SC6-45]MBM1240548.1 sensor histidine kinase N-terminal domain-containing protein [Ponticoccus sp. SC6-49]MBM1245083.1 sensor histidine kinase N-terminal domain-containing protein [Ponticoccus sp. SC2-64]MBM1249513.1 sensor